jgi:hypothetical protein
MIPMPPILHLARFADGAPVSKLLTLTREDFPRRMFFGGILFQKSLQFFVVCRVVASAAVGFASKSHVVSHGQIFTRLFKDDFEVGRQVVGVRTLASSVFFPSW